MVQKEVEKEKKANRYSLALIIPLFFLVLFVTMSLYGLLAFGILTLIPGVDSDRPGLGGEMLYEASMLLAALTVIPLMLRIERLPFSDLGLSPKGHARGLAYGCSVAVSLYLVGFGLSLLTGAVEVTGFRFHPAELAGSWLFFLLVALFEEIVMRGYVLARLLDAGMNRFLALFLSSVVFAGMHLFNPGLGVLPMVNLVLAGLMLGASCLYTRNLCFPISLHLFWNWIQGPVLGYKVSGNDSMSSMLVLHIPESNLLNGGAFGFEGSLICTVLMAILTLLIIRWGERQSCGTPTMLS